MQFYEIKSNEMQQWFGSSVQGNTAIDFFSNQIRDRIDLLFRDGQPTTRKRMGIRLEQDVMSIGVMAILLLCQNHDLPVSICHVQIETVKTTTSIMGRSDGGIAGVYGGIHSNNSMNTNRVHHSMTHGGKQSVKDNNNYNKKWMKTVPQCVLVITLESN
jgi:hypothetical protein